MQTKCDTGRRREWVEKWEDEVERQLRVWCGALELFYPFPRGIHTHSTHWQLSGTLLLWPVWLRRDEMPARLRKGQGQLRIPEEPELVGSQGS